MLPTLDAHAHIKPEHQPEDLAQSGAVLAMTLSLEEAARAVDRRDGLIAWGAGCHPRVVNAHEGFSADQFKKLLKRTAIAGEIGLDTKSRVPLERQLATFRLALEVVADLPRLVSIHSYNATDLVLEELRKRPVAFPVLHWWTGKADQTTQAVELGCYFSIHAAVARHSKFRTRIPPERILLETDHGYDDPPAAIRCRLEWVEYLVAQQLNSSVAEVRWLAWHNLRRIIDATRTIDLLPDAFAQALQHSPG